MTSLIERVNNSRWWVLPCIIWSVMVISVIIRVALAPVHRSTVYPVFALAGQAFADEKPLYDNPQGQFRYSPGWAGFFSLSRDLPQQVASISWRLLNLAVFVFAAFLFQRRFLPNWNQAQLCLWWSLMMPFCLGSFNNAQANLLLLGLLMLSIVWFAEGQWWWCGLVLALAISLKIYPVALALLLLLLQPTRLLLPLVASLLLIMVFPFALGDYHYVVDQYQAWFHSLSGDMRMEIDVSDANRDAWLLIRIAHLPIDFCGYQLIQLLAALALAAWTWLSRTQLLSHSNDYLLRLFNLAIAWMLIFGPASESSTYALLAPLLSMVMVLVLTTRQSPFTIVLTVMSFILMLVAHLGSAVSGGTIPHHWGIHPVAAILLAVAVHRMPMTSRNPQGPPSLPATLPT